VLPRRLFAVSVPPPVAAWEVMVIPVRTLPRRPEAQEGRAAFRPALVRFPSR
jgi:hypothetical protein